MNTPITNIKRIEFLKNSCSKIVFELVVKKFYFFNIRYKVHIWYSLRKVYLIEVRRNNNKIVVDIPFVLPSIGCSKEEMYEWADLNDCEIVSKVNKGLGKYKSE